MKDNRGGIGQDVPVQRQVLYFKIKGTLDNLWPSRTNVFSLKVKLCHITLLTLTNLHKDAVTLCTPNKQTNRTAFAFIVHFIFLNTPAYEGQKKSCIRDNLHIKQ